MDKDGYLGSGEDSLMYWRGRWGEVLVNKYPTFARLSLKKKKCYLSKRKSVLTPGEMFMEYNFEVDSLKQVHGNSILHTGRAHF